MSESFRISEDTLQSHRRTPFFVVLLLLGVLTFKSYGSESILTSALLAAVAVTIYGVISFRQYKDFFRMAQTHVLVMEDHDMVFRDGDIERRLPYSCIERLTFRGSLKNVRALHMKCRNLPEETYHGYERFPRLVDLLLERAPQATVRTRWLFSYNREFQERLAQRRQ